MFTNRSLYYWAKTYISQMGTGDGYHRLNPVICINVLDFVLFPLVEPSPVLFFLLGTRSSRSANCLNSARQSRSLALPDWQNSIALIPSPGYVKNTNQQKKGTTIFPPLINQFEDHV
ncbi:MAG: PD-(D/E)XK nuclease family transposase [Deltaproteobacteria bacterium]|nr:PD-(D/E)XK nuclease family transposase [Deltaproteobacteria bacterium]